MLPIYCNTSVKLQRNKISPQRMTKIKPFIDKYNWEGINSSSKNMIGKKRGKIIYRLL